MICILHFSGLHFCKKNMNCIDILLYIYWLLHANENIFQTPLQIVETNQHIVHLFALYLKLEKNNDNTSRKYWVRPIFRIRRRIAQGASDNLVKEITYADREKYMQYLRMSETNFRQLLRLVEPYIKKQHVIREPIPSYTRLQICLRYLASGDSMSSISFAFRVSSNTVSKIINETCEAIWLALKNSAFPKPSRQMWYNHANQFKDKWNFHHCLGAVDGKLVTMLVN